MGLRRGHQSDGLPKKTRRRDDCVSEPNTVAGIGKISSCFGASRTQQNGRRGVAPDIASSSLGVATKTQEACDACKKAQESLREEFLMSRSSGACKAEGR